MVRVSVKNFGPIAAGSVDLKPLTIFIGPSNTGKSFMATAVYAVMKAFRGDDLVPPRRMFVGGVMYTDKVIGNMLAVPSEDSRFGDAVWEWARELKKEGLDPQQLTVASLPGTVRSALEDITVQEMGKVRSDTLSHLRQTYAYRGSSAFVTRGGQPADFRLTIHRDEPLLDIEIQLVDEDSAGLDFDISNSEVEPSPLALLEYEPEPGRDPIDIFFEVVSSWLNSLAANVLDGVPEQSYYLPAARSGIVQGHKVLAADIVRRSARSGESRTNIPTLPGVTTEFLGNLIGLDRRMYNLSSDDSLVNAIGFIERDVLHGSIDLDDSDGLPYPDIVYESEGEGKFRLDQTSSMVSELAPLVLFLKYLVRPGDLLILEEPESHLHPAAQLQMARGIARLVNAGVKVLITTHSGDIIGQIDNLISMSNASEETARSLGLEQVECLQPEQVSAYGFHIDPDLGGAVTYPLPVGSDVGIEDEEFLPVSELLYEQAITLQRNRLI